MAYIKYTVAIDLGEREIIAIAGYRDAEGTMQIEALSRRPSAGMRAGRIENIAQINEALSSTISDLESQLGVEIQQAYGGMSGEGVRYARHSETIIVEEPNNGVAQSDVTALQSLMRDVLAPDGDTIIEYKPESYLVDGGTEVKSPVGMFGRSLSSTYNFTLCDRDAMKRIELAFQKAGIKLKSCFANSVVAAEAVLTNEEMESGVAVVDLGCGVTNLAIYFRGSLRYMVSIPLGGSSINHDLKSLMVSERNIEEIKIEHGCAVAEIAEGGSVTITGRTARESRNIPKHNIAVAIESRLTDITTFIEKEIRDAGYSSQLRYGVVLTGGGANMEGIDMLFRNNLGLDVRITQPNEIVGIETADKVASSEFATVLGLLQRGIEIDSNSIGDSCAVSIATEIEPELPIEEAATEEEPNVAKQGEKSEEKSPKESDPQSKIIYEEEEIDEEDEEEDDEDYDDEDEDDEESGGMFNKILKKINGLFGSSGGDTF